MSIPLSSFGSPVYVHLSSSNTTQLEGMPPSVNVNQEDVHICGLCKQHFSDINMFVEHKQTCSTHSQKLTPKITSTVPVRQVPQGYVPPTTMSSRESGVPSFTVPYLRVIFDGTNIAIHQTTEDTQKDALQKENKESDILRSRLLGNEMEQQLNIENQDYQNKPSGNLQELVMEQQHCKREFQIDEEDVAALLANQLASDVDISVPAPISSPRETLLKFGSMAGELGVESAKEPVSEHASARGELMTPGPESEQHVRLGETDSSSDTKMPAKPSRVKKKHDCLVAECSFTTTYLKDLARHMRRHTGERPFKCEACSRSFSRNDKLQLHLRIHSGEKPHRCKQCDYATVDSGSLKKHMRIHNDERPYKCQICPYRSRDTSQLTVHLRMHTGDNPFVCRFASCTSAFKTSSDLKRHYRIHTGEKPYVCQHCDYRSGIKSNLLAHIKYNHTEVKHIPCSTCNHESTSKRAAKDHEKTHADMVLECSDCSYTCVTVARMKSHMKSHGKDKSFSCKHCTYICRQQSEFLHSLGVSLQTMCTCLAFLINFLKYLLKQCIRILS